MLSHIQRHIPDDSADYNLLIGVWAVEGSSSIIDNATRLVAIKLALANRVVLEWRMRRRLALGHSFNIDK